MFSLVYSRPLPMKRQRMHALYYRAGLINTSNKSNKTHLPEWSDAYFAVLCTQIKQNTRHGGCIGPLSRYELESRRGRERVNHVVTHLKALFDGLNECEVLNILNVYSVSHPVQYGHAIKAISTLKNVLQSLTAQYRYSAAQKAKQSILSSLFILNEQGDLENRAFIYQLTDGKINTKLIKRIIQTRTNYDTNQSVYLYDAKFDGKYKTMQRMNPRITESITNYWTLNTVPSPHANETRITNHKVRDANGDKPRHQKHKLKGTVVQFYVDWLLTEGNEGSELDNAINSSNATNAIECVSGLRLPVINGTNVTQYGHHADRNAISWNDNVSFRHNPMNSMRMQEPRNAFGSGYYNPYM
eukprot:250207_1